ncbi:MAG TPA: MarR family transcriptional regulator [Ktedonobacteraceae bacterium]|nr:MarR family transcriptional regulator [Ktedonobacteraceae bacterium]
MKVQPEDTIGFVIAQTHRNIDAALTEVLRSCCQMYNKPYEITVAQWGLLYLLSQHDGLPIGVISQQRHVDAPVVTNVVTRLEHIGLVERQHDQQDRRVVKVYLTQEGKDIMRVLPLSVEAFYQSLIRDISEQELQLVKGVLRHLVANVSPPPARESS